MEASLRAVLNPGYTLESHGGKLEDYQCRGASLQSECPGLGPGAGKFQRLPGDSNEQPYSRRLVARGSHAFLIAKC